MHPLKCISVFFPNPGFLLLTNAAWRILDWTCCFYFSSLLPIQCLSLNVKRKHMYDKTKNLVKWICKAYNILAALKFISLKTKHWLVNIIVLSTIGYLSFFETNHMWDYYIIPWNFTCIRIVTTTKYFNCLIPLFYDLVFRVLSFIAYVFVNFKQMIKICVY